MSDDGYLTGDKLIEELEYLCSRTADDAIREIKLLRAERTALRLHLERIIAISDRDHDVWNAAKTALKAYERLSDGSPRPPESSC